MGIEYVYPPTGWPLNIKTISFGFTTLLRISISVHNANEYADFETDSLTTRTPSAGGSGALQENDLSARIALMGAWAALTYTRIQSPDPTAAAMVVFLAAQTIACRTDI